MYLKTELLSSNKILNSYIKKNIYTFISFLSVFNFLIIFSSKLSMVSDSNNLTVMEIN